MAPSINSLVWATDIDVLAPDHTLERRDGYWLVQSPTNPTYWWGNFLVFDDAPQTGDGERWERLFAQEFSARPEVTHCSLAWDRVDGELGAAEQELVARGFVLEHSTGMIARPEQLTAHPRANTEVQVRALDPDGDEALWDAVVEVQMADAGDEFQGSMSDYHLAFVRRRQEDLREIFRSGRGAWYVALLDGVVTTSLGIVVTDRRARYQTVHTLEAYRRLGIASRLVLDAARDAMSRHSIDHFVIVADPDYHAVNIYESLGFERVEAATGALRKPGSA